MQKENLTLKLGPTPLEPGLYIVSTPIGNLKDITLRALETLQSVSRILCEDTRVSGKLTSHYGIKTPLMSYHEHNAHERRPQILEMLEKNEAVALISDAGTPLISDPGHKLVEELISLGHKVFPIPGASAMLSALVASGLPSNRVMFCGFPPPKEKARIDFLNEIKDIEASLILYESPKRMVASLKSMAAVFGDRRVAIGRELTKRFESFYYGSLTQLSETKELFPEKGEFVIVIAPPENMPMGEDDLTEELKKALQNQSVSRAAAEVSARFGLPKRLVYQKALALETGRDEEG